MRKADEAHPRRQSKCVNDLFHDVFSCQLRQRIDARGTEISACTMFNGEKGAVVL